MFFHFYCRSWATAGLKIADLRPGGIEMVEKVFYTINRSVADLTTDEFISRFRVFLLFLSEQLNSVYFETVPAIN